MKTIICFFSIVTLLRPQSWVNTQPPWTGSIAPSRAIDWRGKGVLGGIPKQIGQCGSTIAAFGTAGSPASPASIQSVINACTSGHYVLLGSGDFFLSSGFRIKGQPGVSIFGLGAGLGAIATKIHFSASDTDCNFPFQPGICVENLSEAGYTAPDHTANWKAGYTQGATSITLDSVTGLTVGSILFLDQIDSSNTDNGTLWVNGVQGLASTEGLAGVQRGLYPNTRSEGQSVVVTSITNPSTCAPSCTVGITPGLYMPNWCPEGGGCATSNPGAWWPSDTASKNGVENMLLDSTNNATLGGGNLGFLNCVDCWARNVTLQTAGRASLWILQSARISVQSFYMFGAQAGGSQSYGIETDITSDDLIENGIFQQVTAAMITGEQASGVVYGYNFQIHDTYANPVTWMDAAAYHHSIANVYTLWEGSYVSGMTTDSIHGPSFFQTSFRNYYKGFDTGKNRETDAIQVTATNRYFNYLGNILGTPSFHTTYECAATSASQASCLAGIDLSIYILNWSDHAIIFNNTTTPGVNMSVDSVAGTYSLAGNQAWDGAGATPPTVNYAFTPGSIITFAGFANGGNNVQQTLDSFNTNGCTAGIDCTAVVHSKVGLVTESGRAGASWNETVNNDTLVKTTMFRYSNWDVVNGTTQHNSAEVPTGLASFANRVPPTFYIPISFYLTKQPYWWNVKKQPPIPWPPIGPDVYNGNVTGLGSHVWKIPAMICYLNVMGGPADGSGSILGFDANTCYGPPPPPLVVTNGPQKLPIRMAIGLTSQPPPITYAGASTTAASGSMAK